MRLLLDTHVAIWALTETKRISAEGRGLIADGANTIYVSVVGIWEIAIKRALKRTGAPPFDSAEAIRFFEAIGFELLDITAVHVAATERLPLLHRDPFDRLIVAQAISEPLRLLTHDAIVAAYDPSILQV